MEEAIPIGVPIGVPTYASVPAMDVDVCFDFPGTLLLLMLCPKIQIRQ